MRLVLILSLFALSASVSAAPLSPPDAQISRADHSPPTDCMVQLGERDTAKEHAMKYQTTTPRYIDGVYIDASPQNPAVVEFEETDLHEGDPSLQPLSADGKPVRAVLKPHYAPKVGRDMTASDLHSKPLGDDKDSRPLALDEEARETRIAMDGKPGDSKHVDKGHKRPSDKGPV